MLTGTQLALMALGDTDAFCARHDISVAVNTLSRRTVALGRTVNGVLREIAVRNPCYPDACATPAQALWLSLSEAVQGEKSFAEFTQIGPRWYGDEDPMKLYQEYKERAQQLRWFFSDLRAPSKTTTTPIRHGRREQMANNREEPTQVADISLAFNDERDNAMRKWRVTDSIIGSRTMIPVLIKQFEHGTSGRVRTIGTVEMDVHTLEYPSCTPAPPYEFSAAASPFHLTRTLAVTFNGEMWPLFQEDGQLVLSLPSVEVLREASKPKAPPAVAA